MANSLDQYTEEQLEQALLTAQQQKEVAQQQCRAITKALDAKRNARTAAAVLDTLSPAQRNALVQVQTLRMSGKPQSV